MHLDQPDIPGCHREDRPGEYCHLFADGEPRKMPAAHSAARASLWPRHSWIEQDCVRLRTTASARADRHGLIPSFPLPLSRASVAPLPVALADATLPVESRGWV